jgi:anti-sigma factor RsiW
MDQDHPSTIRLAAYADQELAPPESARVAAHLAQCALCQDHVRWLEKISSDLESFALPPGLGEGTRERVLRALPEREAQRLSSGLLPWLPPVVLAAANIGLQAVFVVALAFTALSAFGIVDVGGNLTALLPTELPADVASIGQVAGDVLGWLTFGSLGPAFRSLVDSTGIDASMLLPWLVPVAIAVAVPTALGTGFVSCVAVAWGFESKNRNQPLRTV